MNVFMPSLRFSEVSYRQNDDTEVHISCVIANEPME